MELRGNLGARRLRTRHRFGHGHGHGGSGGGGSTPPGPGEGLARVYGYENVGVATADDIGTLRVYGYENVVAPVTPVTVVGTSHQNESGTDGTETINYPAGTASGDLIVMIVQTRNGAMQQPSGTGWTERHAVGVSGASLVDIATVDEELRVWTKTAGVETTTGITVDYTSPSNSMMIAIAAYRNAQYGNSDVLFGHTAPSITGADGGDLLCFWATSFDGGTYNAVPAGMTEIVRNNAGSATTRYAAARKALSANGATGGQLISQTELVNYITGVSVAVAPA